MEKKFKRNEEKMEFKKAAEVLERVLVNVSTPECVAPAQASLAILKPCFDEVQEACNTTKFEANVTVANDTCIKKNVCEEPIVCNCDEPEFPDECKFAEVIKEVRDQKRMCIVDTFQKCMNEVKGLPGVLLECLPAPSADDLKAKASALGKNRKALDAVKDKIAALKTRASSGNIVQSSGSGCECSIFCVLSCICPIICPCADITMSLKTGNFCYTD